MDNFIHQGIPPKLIVAIVAKVYKTILKGESEASAVQIASQKFNLPEDTIFAIWRKYKD
ncbi:MAG: hypothetical protein V3G42_10035 [Oscillospiraceae bacterium]